MFKEIKLNAPISPEKLAIIEDQVIKLNENKEPTPDVLSGEENVVLQDGIQEKIPHKDSWFPINIDLPGNQTAQQQQQALELQRRRQNMLIGGGVLLALMVVLVIILKAK